MTSIGSTQAFGPPSAAPRGARSALGSMAAQGAAATAERERALLDAACSDAQGLCVEARAHRRRAARADLRQAVWHEAYELLAAALRDEQPGASIPTQALNRTG